MRRGAEIGLVALTLVVAGSAVAGWRWWHNRAPYGPEALAATASVQLVDSKAAQAALGNGVNAPLAEEGDQLVLGRVSWRPPAKAWDAASFWIVVLDKRTNLKPTVFGVTSPRQDDVGAGSGGTLQRAADRYPWLHGAGGRHVNGSWSDAGSAIYVSAADATPLTFVAVFPYVEKPLPPEQAVVTAPIATPDLLVALVSVGPDEQVYWAQRLVG